ncbi:hypothetical protein [Hyunsoonleella rubra]|uniref:Outer membrane protein assembly factor BamE n=1 Tax=Hyunsoonleella rubra TaxID=1737062 RepID=A0ABW5T632_9FLAO
MIFTPKFIIAFCIIFIAVWIFATTIDKRKWVSFLISVVGAPIFYFYIFYPLINIFFSFHHQKYFDTQAWEDKPALRYEMSGNLLDEKMLIGKSKNEVESLLGESEWFGWDDTLKGNTPEIWNYNLGFKPGAFNTSQECLKIVFKSGKIIEVEQYQIEKKLE